MREEMQQKQTLMTKKFEVLKEMADLKSVVDHGVLRQKGTHAVIEQESQSEEDVRSVWYRIGS